MSSDIKLLNRFARHFKEIEKELSRSFSSRVPMIEDIVKHSLLGEGKRLRPLLFILSSRLSGYNSSNMYYLSTIFEYLHCASLLHDDVIDNADIRRNKPSARSVWGNSAAVVTGDYLSSKATSIAVSTNNFDFLRTMVSTGTRMTEGQFLELTHAYNWGTTKEEYLDIITSKTAALMSAACACGAIIANAGKEETECLRQFGLNIGITFQLIDDLLDYTSSEEEFGKPVGKDIKEGKVTLPLIYTISDMQTKEYRNFENKFNDHNADKEDYTDLIELVRKSGNIEKVRLEALGYVDKATACLSELPDSIYKEELLSLNEYMAKRNY